MASVAGEEEFDDSEVRFSAFVAVVTKSLRSKRYRDRTSSAARVARCGQWLQEQEWEREQRENTERMAWRRVQRREEERLENAEEIIVHRAQLQEEERQERERRRRQR
jgi:hypothetical protein